MFGMFKKKSDLEKLIEKDGIEYAAKRFSEVISQKLPTAEIAYQFILEEIEAASQGNDASINFARNSGISPQEYKGSMSNSMPEIDGPDGPQQLILALCMQLQPNVNLVVKFRTMIVDNIMKALSFGKYENNSNSGSGDKLWEWIQNDCNSVKFEPQEIEAWSDLEELDLRTNDLSELSDDLAILSGLVKLSLFHNNFSIVPEVVFKLTALERLNLGVNQIADLHQDVGRLRKLKTLDLGQNQLINLPREIGELKNLEQLYVHNNSLTEIPKEIGGMTDLKHISLYENNLSDLPDEILNLKNLKTIELQNNNFTDENAKKWTDRFSNTKCKISFGYQQGNISEPIYIETNIKGGIPEDSFLEMYLNSKDGDMVSDIFHWSSSDENEGDFLSIYMANKKYNKISINEGLTAIKPDNIIVPINMELNAETPSEEGELIEWVKIIYIETCNENNLKPNPKLRIVSVGSSASEKTLKMMER